MASLEEEMVASYEIDIQGIPKVHSDMAALDNSIRLLRAAQYSATTNVTGAGSFAGGDDIFVSYIDGLEGQVRTVASKTMLAGMDYGKKIQAATLRAATTDNGKAGASHSAKGRTGGAGREDTGKLIKEIKRNVEIVRSGRDTTITGWHGWREGREEYFQYQESGSFGRGGGSMAGVRRKRRGKKSGGNKGIQAVNSLGAAIVPVREKLITELGYLK